MAAERAYRKDRCEKHRDRQYEKHLLGQIEHVRQRHRARLDPATHVLIELVGQIDHDRENREAEQRDEENAQPLAEEVQVERPQRGMRNEESGTKPHDQFRIPNFAFRIRVTQPNSPSFSSSQSPPCAVLPARRTDRSSGIATIRKMRFGVHIARKGGTMSRSPSSSPPMRPT